MNKANCEDCKFYYLSEGYGECKEEKEGQDLPVNSYPIDGKKFNNCTHFKLATKNKIFLNQSVRKYFGSPWIALAVIGSFGLFFSLIFMALSITILSSILSIIF